MPVEWYIYNTTIPLTATSNTNNSDQNKKLPSIDSIEFTKIIQKKDITLSPATLINSLADLVVDGINGNNKSNGNKPGIDSSVKKQSKNNFC